MPEQPIDQAILCGLAEQLEFLTGNIGLANEAAKRLAKLQKDDPLYDTKVNRLCSELFLEGAARLPDAVTPEAIQEHLELVTTLTRSRFQALAQKDGRLAADKPTRISHEKAYKQYFLQDFKSRLEALSEPAEPGEDAGEGMPRPIFSNDEEAVIMHLQRFADEVIDTAIAQARLDCKAIIKDFAAIDARIDAASDNWTLMRLDRADRCLLRLGTYEMLYASPKVTPAIAINEAIELAKRFCKQDSPAFVNGVLERIRVTAAAEPITFGA